MDSLVQARVRLLLRRYLANQCSASEMEELFRHISDYPDDALWASWIDDEMTANETEPLPSEKITLSLWQAIEKRQRNTKVRKKEPRQFVVPHLLKVAAVFLAGVFCASVLYLYLDGTQSSVVERKTAFGEMLEITLPDSSTVVLNGNSSVRYASDWNDRMKREVYLSGEGFFKVVHLSDNKKFHVHTDNGITIEVLGTEFNVNDRRSRTRVVLQSGKIRLGLANSERSNDGIIMRSGEYVEVQKGSNAVMRRKVDSDVYTSWTNRKFIFKETPLRDILYLLEDNYGIVSSVDNVSVLDEKFTATYSSDNIEVLLKALEKSFRIEITRVRQTGYE